MRVQASMQPAPVVLLPSVGLENAVGGKARSYHARSGSSNDIMYDNLGACANLPGQPQIAQWSRNPAGLLRCNNV